MSAPTLVSIADEAAALAARKRRFAEALRDGLPGMEALEAAGYSMSTRAVARAQLSRLMRDAEVRRIAFPEPETPAEMATKVWNLAQQADSPAIKASLLGLYARLKGYTGARSAAPAAPPSLDDDLTEFSE